MRRPKDGAWLLFATIIFVVAFEVVGFVSAFTIMIVVGFGNLMTADVGQE